MNCYNCGCRLSEHDFCTACGVDVSLYKKIRKVSNLYYNQGLEKAGVRDLTGAVTSLRQSLKFNKNNVEARNLLGLVYFEMGEVVAALSEWVISKNLRPSKNIADDYINMLQSNATGLESINQTIKKYNQALVYCMQDSKDLAVIQLKKVLSLNPKFIRAHQLLALLYIDSEQWDKAKRELVKCTNIDNNNTLTKRYMKEVNDMLEPDENLKGQIKGKIDESVRYQSDNEIIIQPLNVKEPKNNGLSTLFNVAIGLILGMAAMYFLVLPAALTAQKKDASAQFITLSEEMDIKTAQVAEMELTIGDLQQQKNELQSQLEEYVGEGGTLKSIDNLLEAAKEYINNGDIAAIASYLEGIEAGVTIENTTQSFQDVYYLLLTKIGPTLSSSLYTTGYQAYKDELYELAIADLVKAVYYNADNADALFTLGNAYKKNGDKVQAIETYEKVIELFPNTQKAKQSKQYVEDLNNG